VRDECPRRARKEGRADYVGRVGSVRMPVREVVVRVQYFVYCGGDVSIMDTP
jgi:hypothetical protein